MPDRAAPLALLRTAENLSANLDSLLWAMVYAQFSFHRKPRPDGTKESAEDAMNRIPRKQGVMRDQLHCRLSPATCDIREEVIYADAILLTFHPRAHPVVLTLPPVILALKRELFVIEGTTRVNAWRRAASLPPPEGTNPWREVGLEAIVITPREVQR